MKEKIEKRLESLKNERYYRGNHYEFNILDRGIEVLEIVLDALNFDD